MRTSKNLERLKNLNNKLDDVLYLVDSFLNVFGFIYVALDKDGKIVFVSKAWEDYLEYSIKETLGTHFMDYVHPDDYEETARIFEGGPKLPFSGSTVFVNRYITKSGKIIEMRWQGYSIEPKNEYRLGVAQPIRVGD